LEFGVLVFAEGGRPQNPEKNLLSKVRTNNKLNPHMTLGWNWTQATLVRGERSHYYAIAAPLYFLLCQLYTFKLTQTCILPIAPMATSGGIITGLAYVPPICDCESHYY